MIQAKIQSTPDGAIVFDAAALPQALDASGFDPAWFEPAYWNARGQGTTIDGGRGGVRYVELACGPCVLRHYHRGGMIARVLGDRYLWSGAERTRGFAEFHLLTELRERDLPVPMPIAARYRKRGKYYRADLITRRIEHADTLAQLLATQRVDVGVAGRVGATIARCHAAGAYHPDLNAHNVLVGAVGVWLIDFDRGALRPPACAWQRANLARLQRSLLKLGAAHNGEAAFERSLWQPLVAAWEKGIAS